MGTWTEIKSTELGFVTQMQMKMTFNGLILESEKEARRTSRKRKDEVKREEKVEAKTKEKCNLGITVMSWVQVIYWMVGSMFFCYKG